MPTALRLLLPALITCLSTACTIYPDGGPRRPDSQLAILKSYDTSVMTLDGKNVADFSGNWATYKLKPGRREVGIVLNETRAGPRRMDLRPMTVNFRFKAGKTYLTRPEWLGERWRPVIVELKKKD